MVICLNVFAKKLYFFNQIVTAGVKYEIYFNRKNIHIIQENEDTLHFSLRLKINSSANLKKFHLDLNEVNWRHKWIVYLYSVAFYLGKFTADAERQFQIQLLKVYVDPDHF